jgi:hypothetical protein
VRITSHDDYTGSYTFHEWSFKTRDCTDIRKCVGEGDWDVTAPDAVRAFFLINGEFGHSSEDCRCLLWFEGEAGAEDWIGSAEGNEIISNAGEESYDITRTMRHYWIHCQVNYEHQLSFYRFDSEEYSG